MPMRRRTSTGSTPLSYRSCAVVQDLALDAGARDQVVHPVDRAQQRALAAARRPDERRDPVRRDVERDVLHGPERAVEEAEILELEDRPDGSVGWRGAIGRAAGGTLDVESIDGSGRRAHRSVASSVWFASGRPSDRVITTSVRSGCGGRIAIALASSVTTSSTMIAAAVSCRNSSWGSVAQL